MLVIVVAAAVVLWIRHRKATESTGVAAEEKQQGHSVYAIGVAWSPGRTTRPPSVSATLRRKEGSVTLKLVLRMGADQLHIY